MELYPALSHIYIYYNICNILLILFTHLFTILKLMFYPFMYPQFLKYCESAININWMSELETHSLCLCSWQPLVSALPSLSLTQVWRLLFNRSVMSNSLQPHGLQHTRLPCLSPSPEQTRVWVDSRSWWWTGRPGVLRFMGREELDMTEPLNWTEVLLYSSKWQLCLAVPWSEYNTILRVVLFCVF